MVSSTCIAVLLEVLGHLLHKEHPLDVDVGGHSAAGMEGQATGVEG